ncbi:MAG: hypothetical protein ACE5ES_03735 [Candidatus Nanoarchaeia archaeon]
MENKLLYAGLGILILFLAVAVIAKPQLNSNVVKEQEIINPKLEKYRSTNIPEECRLPKYENSIEEWKEHLSHHKPTWYCLEDYYGIGDVEEFLKGGQN